MADMKRIKGRIAETIYPNGTGAITAESHQALLLEMVDDINEKKADKEEVTTVEESVSMLSQEVESNYINLTESLDALEQKLDNLPQGGGDFDPSGTYPNLTAGDLAGRGESVPASFGFRASGGKSIKDGRAYIKRIKGNSVVWNQKNDKSTRPANGDNTQGSAPMYDTIGNETHYKECIGHKIYARAISSDANIDRIYYTDNVQMNLLDGALFTASASATNIGIVARIPVGVRVDNASINIIFHDLTQMFQAGNEPTTIEDFQSRVATLGVDMNAYNEGQVIHCNTESIKSVGDNAWDEQWEKGYINSGTAILEGNAFSSINHIKVLPNETYYFTISALSGDSYFYIWLYDQDKNVLGHSTIDKYGDGLLSVPSNCHYIRFYVEGMTTYNHDILISLYHSGWKAQKDDQYQPYWEDTLPLPIIRKYFPDGMKKAGTAHDEIRYNKASGKWEAVKRIGVVDMGTLSWFKTWYTENEKWRIYANLPSKVKGQNNLLTKKYVTSYTDNGTMPDISITGNNPNSYIYIKDSSYSAQGADALIASLQGVMLYYELAEPIVTEITEDFRDYYNVADFGTEQSQSEVPSAPFSADIIYQFNAVDMIREHELEITELQSIIATMQAQLTSLINGGQ